MAEAERVYRQILTMDPLHADSLHLLGMIAFQAGDLETAVELIRRAIAINGQGASYYANLGNVLQAQGKLDEAEVQCGLALALKPDLTEVHINLGNILQARGELDGSVACYERALALNPNSAEAHNNLGNARQKQELMDAAVACYRVALALRPNYAECYNNLGNALQAEGRLHDAQACYEQALAIEPNYAMARYSMGYLLSELGHPDEALIQYRKALELQPDYAQAGFSEALVQLLQGNFADGWRNFERRWRSVDHKTSMRAYPQPFWTGETLASGSLLLWGEQGVGDEIMFAGLIPDVIRTGIRCILDCDARLRPLFARSFPGAEVVSGFDPERHPDLHIAAHLPTGSLPRQFRSTCLAFSAATSPYLIADPVERQRFRARYDDGRRLVGLAWRTSNQSTGRGRSIDLSLFGPWFAQPNIRWVSLQYGDHDTLEYQAAAAGAPILVDRDVDQFTNIDIFAAQIAALDLVITIDNSTAHLAGALGVPVWVLLPFTPDWRWLLNREDSPWYPTMRLIRQPKQGDWQSVVQEIQSDLGESTRRHWMRWWTRM